MGHSIRRDTPHAIFKMKEMPSWWIRSSVIWYQIAGEAFSLSYSTVQKEVDSLRCQSRFSIRFLRESSIENREPFIENREPVIENWELLIENRVEDRVSRVRKQRFSHDWFLDNFTLSELTEPQAATPVLHEQMYASKREKSKLIGEKCVLKYFL